jgi:Ca2+-binding EF-hand superfamily protein
MERTMKFSKLVFSILTVLGTSVAFNAFAQTTPATPAAASSAPPATMKGHGFAALDQNSDGVISRDEVAARPKLAKMFDKLDTNKDGVLSKDEMKVAHAKLAERHFFKMDTDRDGRISRTEAAGHPKLAENFDRIDTNGDGFLSKEELVAARDSRKSLAAKK